MAKRRTAEPRRRNQAFRRQYMTARWAKVRRLVLARDNGLCVDCGNGYESKRMHADHIIPAEQRPDLFYSLDNLATRCDVCHARKTRKGL